MLITSEIRIRSVASLFCVGINWILIIIALGYTLRSHASDMLNVPQHIWDGLEVEQRKIIGDRYIINILDGKNYGVIIDAQGLNESTRETTSGSQLASRVASAVYVDSAFSGAPRNWNYSASGHLAAQLAGAVIGSMVDKPGEEKFRTRYTIKTGLGGVEYVEENRSDALRHSIGICVTTRPIKPIEFDICNQTREQFLAKFSEIFSLKKASNPSDFTIDSNRVVPTSISVLMPTPVVQQKSVMSDDAVQCKIGLSSPVRVSASVCESAGGAVIR